MNKKENGKRKMEKSGFTLVEIIVSLGIFAVVAVVALGALVKIVAANKKAQTIQASVTNINFALDAISREMRVGRNYYCSSVAGSSINGLNGALAGVDRLDRNYTDSSKCPRGSSNENFGTVIAFDSTKVDNSGGGSCNLIFAYLFHRRSSDEPYRLYKAEQPSCNSSAYDFTEIIDPNVTLDGYYVKVVATSENPFPRATIRMSGYAGTTEKDKTYFDVQTTVSARVQ